MTIKQTMPIKKVAGKSAPDSKLVGVRMDQALQDAIQNWLDGQKAKGYDLTLSQAIRFLIQAGLRAENPKK